MRESDDHRDQNTSPMLVEAISDDIAMSFPPIWREIIWYRSIRRVAALVAIVILVSLISSSEELALRIVCACLIIGFLGIEVAFAWLLYVAKGPFSRESLLRRVLTVGNGQILVRQGRMSATIPIKGAVWREIQSVPRELKDLGFPDIACIVVSAPGKSLWSRCAVIVCGFDEASRSNWRQ